MVPCCCDVTQLVNGLTHPTPATLLYAVQVAFVRVVSGKFEKGMKVKVARSGRVVTLARPSQMFAQSRATVQEGFAGQC